MYYRIDRNYLDGPTSERTVRTVGEREQAEGEIIRFRLLDDDRIPYFGGEADDEGLEPAFDWAIYDSGCTILQVRDGEGGWEDCIS
jgi:hypothetical protein